MKTQQFIRGCQFPLINPVIIWRPTATAGFKHPVDVAKCLEKKRAIDIVSIFKNWLGVKSVFSFVTIRIVQMNTNAPIASEATSWKKTVDPAKSLDGPLT